MLKLSRGAALAARWLHEPQPISHQPMGLGFPHCAGRFRSRRSSFSSPVCWICKRREIFLIGGLEFKFPKCCETLTLRGGATLAARRLHEPSPISNQPMGMGFPHLVGGIDPGDNCFRPRGVGFLDV